MLGSTDLSEEKVMSIVTMSTLLGRVFKLLASTPNSSTISSFLHFKEG